jgi:FkbM family methyltransferase
MIELREGVWWPVQDTKCWENLHRWIDVPDILMQHVPNKNVMVQAGGNCGLYTKEYAKHFKKAVYTFEPVAELFECLVRNVPDEHVIKFQACIGNERNLVSINPHDGGDIGGGHVGSSGIIPTLKIDDLGLDECNLIHLDVEGYEKFALAGARDTIVKCRPVICIENCEKWLKRYDTNISEIEDFLATLGYTYKASARGDRIYVWTS